MDACLGAGGHAVRILEKTPAHCRLLGIDRDPAALDIAAKRLAPYGDRVTMVRADFRQLADILAQVGTDRISGVLFDPGLSSMQLDDVERGFAYATDGPLDMRADPTQELTAETIVNTYPAKTLADIFYNYGEERRSRQAAARILELREQKRITTTAQLAKLLRPVLSAKHYHRSLARIWMALRIAVNDELGALSEGLAAGVSSLDVGGRIVVLAYHSLEDRIVKRAFREWSRECGCSPALGDCVCGANPKITLLTKRPELPSPEEITENSRAASAKLRAAEKTVPGSVMSIPSGPAGAI